MRISDWSSDVCSSDLIGDAAAVEVIRQPAALAGVTGLTHDIKEVILTVNKPIYYRAGQYANIHWGDGTVHRSYSFAAPPSAGGIGEPSFFIRHIPGGLFTDRLFSGSIDELPLEIDGPHGNFWLREGKGPIPCLAGGSGLCPPPPL